MWSWRDRRKRRKQGRQNNESQKLANKKIDPQVSAITAETNTKQIPNDILHPRPEAKFSVAEIPEKRGKHSEFILADAQNTETASEVTDTGTKVDVASYVVTTTGKDRKHANHNKHAKRSKHAKRIKYSKHTENELADTRSTEAAPEDTNTGTTVDEASYVVATSGKPRRRDKHDWRNKRDRRSKRDKHTKPENDAVNTRDPEATSENAAEPPHAAVAPEKPRESGKHDDNTVAGVQQSARASSVVASGDEKTPRNARKRAVPTGGVNKREVKRRKQGAESSDELSGRNQTLTGSNDAASLPATIPGINVCPYSQIASRELPYR